MTILSNKKQQQPVVQQQQQVQAQQQQNVSLASNPETNLTLSNNNESGISIVPQQINTLLSESEVNLTSINDADKIDFVNIIVAPISPNNCNSSAAFSSTNLPIIVDHEIVADAKLDNKVVITENNNNNSENNIIKKSPQKKDEAKTVSIQINDLQKVKHLFFLIFFYFIN
jgi:hypothetical protein